MLCSDTIKRIVCVRQLVQIALFVKEKDSKVSHIDYDMEGFVERRDLGHTPSRVPGSLTLTLSIFHESFLLIPGFFPENEEISAPPPRGFLVGIYLFYENWSTESFRKKESKKWAVPSTYKSSNLFIKDDCRLPLKSSSLRHSERLQPHHQFLPCTAMDIYGSQPF
jgi:hypothetical protein